MAACVLALMIQHLLFDAEYLTFAVVVGEKFKPLRCGFCSF